MDTEFCKVCGKVPYDTERKAKQAIREKRSWKNGASYAYYATDCDCWHLTRKRTRTKRGKQ